MLPLSYLPVHTTNRLLVSAETEDDYHLAIFTEGERAKALAYADQMADMGYRVIVTTVG